MRAFRGFWRNLTSMRTALILLLLLAVAAIPGSLLPQKSVNIENVRGYLAAHPDLGPWLDRLWFFDVYSSPWFSAIYLVLFVSLVGCLVPRLRQHLGNLIAKPPRAPRRLDRLPHSRSGLTAGSPPAEVAAGVCERLRGQRWRTVAREQADGSVSVSAEKGYLKETGNLVFHFALLALLVGVAYGSWYGWHGNRLVVAGEEYGFCNTPQQYDESGLGERVGAADLPPFCVTLNDFHAEYNDHGQPLSYAADVSYAEGNAATQPDRIEVNSPLRLSGANVYLLGHGYAPILRYTDRYGVSQTKVVPFLIDDLQVLTSSGVAKFPDVNVDPSGKPSEGAPLEVAFTGVYLPTMSDQVDGRMSIFPAENNPRLQLTAYQGDLGLGSGAPQSVYDLDQRKIATGELRKVADSAALKPGEALTLPDGTRVEFLGTRQWITVSVRHDPGEPIVLGGAVALMLGLMVSLSGKRRRVWVRVEPSGDGRSLISLGGLARSEYPGFADEFARVVELAGADAPRPPVAVVPKEN
jgi:cytochrome c biogenesis protein